MSITALLSPKALEANSVLDLIRRSGSVMATNGTLPHVSLAVFDEIDLAGLSTACEAVANSENPIELAFPNTEIFPGENAVAYLEASASVRLRKIHGRLIDMLGVNRRCVRDHYLPEAWRPHMTLAAPVSENEASRVCKAALETGLCRTYWFDRIEIVITPPWTIWRSFQFRDPSS